MSATNTSPRHKADASIDIPILVHRCEPFRYTSNEFREAQLRGTGEENAIKTIYDLKKK